jgi:hypothetical protein
MSDATTTQGVLFPSLVSRPVHARFDQPAASSDGGALLLKAVDDRLGLSSALAGCIRDNRDPTRVTHSMLDLLRQRIFLLANGYEDCNDATRLVDDPVPRMLLDRDPIDGDDIASQPTLSRFENRIDGRSLVRMGHALADTVIESQRQRRKRQRVRRITIDMDPTDDPTHGQQQLTLFNGHYDTWCYLPVAAFLQFGEEREQHLFAYVLRPGDAHASDGAIAILERTIEKLRQAFPRTTLRVRLDGGYATEEIFEYLDEAGVEYVVAIQGNSVLRAHAEALMPAVRKRSANSGATEHDYGECEYGADSWERFRRVIIKAEVVRLGERAPKDNPRFVVTNLSQTPRFVYESVYCQRGSVENRIKELLYGLDIDRTSCHRFFANQFRALMTAAAYVLYQQLRYEARGTSLANAQVSTLRERLIKLGAWIERSTRRIVLHLPDSAPWRNDWCRIARRIGAVPI